MSCRIQRLCISNIRAVKVAKKIDASGKRHDSEILFPDQSPFFSIWFLREGFGFLVNNLKVSVLIIWIAQGPRLTLPFSTSKSAVGCAAMLI
jgi:hypothetical protein